MYVGGFAGLMRNDIMKGALKEVGIELVRVAQPPERDVWLRAFGRCDRRGGELRRGGFTGAMANSYAVDTTMAGTMAVRATGHAKRIRTTFAPSRRLRAASPESHLWAGRRTWALPRTETATCWRA
ncbi:MAG: hypothetical protein ACLTSX_03750 [Collinsella sp.]